MNLTSNNLNYPFNSSTVLHALWYLYFVSLLIYFPVYLYLFIQFVYHVLLSFFYYAFLYAAFFPPQLSFNTCVCFIRLMIVPFTRVRNRGAAVLPFLNHAWLLDASHLLDACHFSLLW